MREMGNATEQMGLAGAGHGELGLELEDEQERDDALLAGAEPIARSQWNLFLRRFFKHKVAVVSLVILVVLIVACFTAQWWAPYPKNEQDLLAMTQPPSAKHWFGTDELGRDVFSETLYAGQTSLRIGLVVAALSTIIGALVGATAGYFRGWSDQLLMRFTDLFIVLPQLIVLAIMLQKYGGSGWVVALVLAAIFWMGVARIVRGQVLSIREKEFVDAARAAGASARRIVFRHIIPNSIGPILVAATLAVAGAILTESALSYLGFGVRPPDTSWGSMLSNARGYLGTNLAYLMYFPGLMIFLTVLAVNFLGDGLRDAFDPHSKH